AQPCDRGRGVGLRHCGGSLRPRRRGQGGGHRLRRQYRPGEICATHGLARTYGTVMRLTLALCLASLAAPPPCRAQAPAQIRVDVSLVNVGFSVRDDKGNLVTNLTRDDFEIAEDGVPQKISFFARSTDVPLTLGLIMDVSGSQQSFLKPHHNDLQAFLKTVLLPRDRAFLVCFGNNLRLMSDYSNSPMELVDSLKEFEKGKNIEDFPLLGPIEHRVLGTAFYDAVFYSSTQMMQNVERGRRALIVFSDGEDNSSAHHMMEA